MAAIETGWERNKRIHFDNIVDDYDRMRPEYPREIFEDVIKYSKVSTGKSAVEIGAGTGKATQPFLDAGYNITAVEIGSNMAEFLLKRFSAYKGFKVVVSSFEDVVLQEDSFDLIYAATAFHWVDAEIGCPKAYRLLKDGGVIALFRYNAIAAIGDELYEEIQHVYEEHYYSYYTSGARPIKKSKDDFEKPSEIYNSFRFEDLKIYGFKDISMKFRPKTNGAAICEELLPRLYSLDEWRKVKGNAPKSQKRRAFPSPICQFFEIHTCEAKPCLGFYPGEPS